MNIHDEQRSDKCCISEWKRITSIAYGKGGELAGTPVKVPAAVNEHLNQPCLQYRLVEGGVVAAKIAHHIARSCPDLSLLGAQAAASSALSSLPVQANLQTLGLVRYQPPSGPVSEVVLSSTGCPHHVASLCSHFTF